VVIVVDGNPDVFDRVREDFGSQENVVLHNNDENQGISYSRTKGAKLASGEVVAMIDDDAVAEPDWIAELVSVYTSTDAVVVGGRVAPNWVSGKPDFFPRNFTGWLAVTNADLASIWRNSGIRTARISRISETCFWRSVATMKIRVEKATDTFRPTKHRFVCAFGSRLARV